jgi:hypothetical protein
VVLTAKQAVATVERLHKKLSKRQSEIEGLENAFAGQQPLRFATQEWSKAHGERYKNFSDNWCGVVGSAPAERTGLNGFKVGDDGESASADEKGLWRDWEVNEGPSQSSQGFQTSTVAKRSSVLVWGDTNDDPVMTWEHPSQVVVDYDPEQPRIRRYALKAWRDDDTHFAILYTPEEVWKFKRSSGAIASIKGRTETGLEVVSRGLQTGGGWAMWQPETDDKWPIANPLGRVPVVEFQNRPRLMHGPLSDIEGTMAMQNAINLLWAYLFVAADYASMPARVVLGQEPPKIPVLDENGQPTGKTIPVDQEKLKHGRMLWLTGDKASIDQWSAANLEVFTDVINISVRHVAAQTRTPIYLVHGELGNVNGETLTGLDAPLVSKVKQSQEVYQGPMREVFSLMAGVRGQTGLADACRTGQVLWKNAEVRSDSQVSDAAVKDRQIGWPLAAVLERRYGLDQPTISRIMAQVEAEKSDPVLERMARDAAGGAFGEQDSAEEPAPAGA